MDYSRTVPQSRAVTLDANGAGVIPGNLRRFAIVIGAPPTKTIFVITGASDGQNAGPLVNSNLGFIELTQERYGDGVREYIRIVATDGAASAGQLVGYTEFIRVPWGAGGPLAGRSGPLVEPGKVALRGRDAA